MCHASEEEGSPGEQAKCLVFMPNVRLLLHTNEQSEWLPSKIPTRDSMAAFVHRGQSTVVSESALCLSFYNSDSAFGVRLVMLMVHNRFLIQRLPHSDHSLAPNIESNQST